MTRYTPADKYINGHYQNGVRPEHWARILAALDEGYSYDACADIYGISANAIRKHHPGKGWTYHQARQLGTYMKHHNHKMRAVPKGAASSVKRDL
jgi:uncharacterized protein YjcR